MDERAHLTHALVLALQDASQVFLSSMRFVCALFGGLQDALIAAGPREVGFGGLLRSWATFRTLYGNCAKVVHDVESTTVQMGGCTVRCIHSPFATDRFQMRRCLSNVKDDVYVYRAGDDADEYVDWLPPKPECEIMLRAFWLEASSEPERFLRHRTQLPRRSRPTWPLH